MLLIATTTSGPTLGTGMVIIGFLCYLSRKEPLGGWLRFFFWQVFLGSVATVSLIDPDYFHPAKWKSPGSYAIAAVLFFPLLTAKAAECVISVMLVWKRSWGWVRYMRITLWFDAVWQVMSLIASGLIYGQNIVYQCITAIGPIVWLAYFYKSDRVVRVFRDKTWTVAPIGKDLDLTNPDDAKELLRRATRMEIKGHYEAALLAYQEIATKFRGTTLGKDAQISHDELSAKLAARLPSA